MKSSTNKLYVLTLFTPEDPVKTIYTFLITVPSYLYQSVPTSYLRRLVLLRRPVPSSVSSQSLRSSVSCTVTSYVGVSTMREPLDQ